MGQSERRGRQDAAQSALLLALAAGATLTIWISNPLADWTCELGLLLLGAWSAIRLGWPARVPGLVLAGIAVWGFAQLAAGAVSGNWDAWTASIRVAALVAAALCARALAVEARLEMYLRAFAWFGFAIATTAVLAFYLSSERILWIFPIAGAQAWGPFLSRNNFAQFLELALPVALWLGLTTRAEPYIWMSAAILGAGLASASRAGAVALIGETVLVLVLVRGRSWSRLAGFAMLAVAFSSVAGADVLLRRMAAGNPFEYRREIAQSTVAMIAARPWAGFGPGSFARVYPAYATFDAGRVVEHAHNDWLEFAAEGGTGYAVLWAVLALSAAPRAIRSVWGVGICAVFLHALVDYPFVRLGVAVWVFILIGILSGMNEKTRPKSTL